jgi:hypothetical protein
LCFQLQEEISQVFCKFLFFRFELEHTNLAVAFFTDELWGISEMNSSADLWTDHGLIWKFEEVLHILRQARSISNFRSVAIFLVHYSVIYFKMKQPLYKLKNFKPF